ncbi:MAG: hypothetical protein JNK85_20865 [Verrucomicrobiales bacterium]|nr:hypothetical protein [Verrucomicrobiales bacterium]
MKACRSYRKRLAVWAGGEVDASEAAVLRNHCSQCSSCAAYFRELSAVAAEHRAAGHGGPMGESENWDENFHQEWKARILPGPGPASTSRRRAPLARPTLHPWRWAWIGGALMVMGWFGWERWQVPSSGRRDSGSVAAVTAQLAAPIASASPASVRSYRWAAAQSPEAFETLLARNARESVPEQMPIRAFSRGFPDSAD